MDCDELVLTLDHPSLIRRYTNDGADAFASYGDDGLVHLPISLMSVR